MLEDWNLTASGSRGIFLFLFFFVIDFVLTLLFEALTK